MIINIIYIVIIVILLKILYKKEKFTNLSEEDSEAIANVSKMITDDNLKIKKLHIENDIEAKNAIFGSTYVGTGPVNDVAFFSHKNLKDDEKGYAIGQDKNGNTAINSKEKVYMRKNNVDDEVRCYEGYFGPTYIGGNTHNNYAWISHRDKKSDGNAYAILQSSNGSTLINSKNNTVSARKNNDENSGKIYTTGRADISHIYNDTTETKAIRPRFHKDWSHYHFSELYGDAAASTGDVIFTKISHGGHNHKNKGGWFVVSGAGGKGYIRGTDGNHSGHWALQPINRGYAHIHI